MSHFLVYVFGDNVEELLAPYDENIECEPYIKYTKAEAIAETRKYIERYKNGTYAEYLADPEAYKAKCQRFDNEHHFHYLEYEFPKKLKQTDEECYQDVAQFYDEEYIDEEGNLYSTYNPKSKWDWWEVGGRWDKVLKTKENDKTNSDRVGNINWKKSGTPFALVLPNGEWYEKGEMGWWVIVTNEKDADEWNKEFFKLVETLDDNLLVTVVDCHI